MASLGNLLMIGDSLFRGDAGASPIFYSPAQSLKNLLVAGGHTATFVGFNLADPGSIPVGSSGGWTIASLEANRTNFINTSPQTIVLQIGTNVIGVSSPNVGTDMTSFLNNMASDLGSGKRYYIFAPVNLSWFDQPSYTLLKNAMSSWCAVDTTNRFFAELLSSGIGDGSNSTYFNPDGTHWKEAGANLIASYIDTRIDLSFASGNSMISDFQGFDLATILSNANAAANGQQKLTYANQLITALGANPLYTIEVGGVVKYSAVVGGLTSSSVGVLIPPQFNEPPTINISDALTASTAVEVIRNASNPAIRIVTPIKAGGAAGFLTIDKGLNGTYTIRSNARRLLSPAIFDSASAPPPGGGTVATITMAQLIDFMSVADDPTGYGGVPPARQAAMQTPINIAGMQYICQYPRTDGQGNSNFYNEWDAIPLWLWIFLSDQFTATGKRIQYRNMQLCILLDSPTGTWYQGPVHARVGSSANTQLWEGTSRLGAPVTRLNGMMRDEIDANGGGSSVALSGNEGVEMWANPGFMAITNRSIMARAYSGAAIAQIRVINNDGTVYTGTDAKPLAAMGGDMYAPNVQNPNLSPDGLSKGIDGFKSRWKRIDCSGGWQPVAFVSVDFCYKKDGPRPPWGNYTGSWAVTGSVYNLTNAQLQANPPPFVSG